MKDARARLAAIGRHDPQVRMGRLREGAAGLEAMIRAAGEHAEARRRGAEAANTLNEQAGRREAAHAALTSATDERARAEAAIAALQAPVDRAEAAITAEAARLRRSLESGCPCPVCGSVDHPVHADETLARIARDMREALDAERRRSSAATEAFAAARRAIESADFAIARATETREAAEVATIALAADFGAARDVTAATGLMALPERPEGAAALLVGRKAELDARRAEIAALIGEEKTLRTSLDEVGETLATLQAAIAARAERREEETAIAADKSAEGRLAEQDARHAAGRIAAIDREIAPALAADTLTTEALDRDAPAIRARLAGVAERWKAQVAARDRAGEMLNTLAQKIASATAEQHGALKSFETAAAILKARYETRDTLREGRGRLLGGEATEVHRTRHNSARLRAQQELERLSAELNGINGLKSGADARLASIRHALGLAREEARGAGEELDGKLDSAGMDRAALDGLLHDGAAEAGRLRTFLRSIDDAVTGARSTREAREADLRALLDKGLPAEPEAGLREAKDAAEAAQGGKRERVGAIAAQLAADDRVRGQLRGLDAAIRSAREICDTWAAVNEAAGSRQGGKFAQIAQGVTLSMLVERANQHLADLEPRYRLMRGGDDLALHIVDRDLGSEIRSTRSLSGGERFLVSLSLALALSRMGSHGGLAATLFIDEGFGSLDAESLDMAIDALEALQAQGSTVGVISHVEAMKDRIPVQVRVTRNSAGASSVELAGIA